MLWWPYKYSLRRKAMKVHRNLLKFVKENRNLLEKKLIGPGHSIELKAGVEYYSCNYWLRCFRAADGNIDIKFFRIGGKIEVLYDPTITDHQDLLTHLWWTIRDYDASLYHLDASCESSISPTLH